MPNMGNPRPNREQFLMHKGHAVKAKARLDELRLLFNTLLELAKEEMGSELEVTYRRMFLDIRGFISKAEMYLPTEKTFRSRRKKEERNRRWEEKKRLRESQLEQQKGGTQEDDE